MALGINAEVDWEGTAWHTLTAEDVVSRLGSNGEGGLTSEEAKRRLEDYGPNELEGGKGRTPLDMFWAQLKEPLVLVLIASAAISILVGEVTDSIVILAIVILNSVLGVLQEWKAEKSLAALKKLSAPSAKVKRDGQVKVITASEIVPGDIVLLDAGDNVPADARLITVASLKVAEAALTGEAVPVDKSTEALPDAEATLGDRTNMVYMGTACTDGRGEAVVVATGMRTEMGKIATMLKSAEERTTPLQERLEVLGKYLGIAALGLCAVIFVAGVLRGQHVFDMFMTAISLAVAAIPEGLPAVVTIVLAIGVSRMAERRAIIRKLPAVETLGSATVICSDKTGTLTENEMTVRQVYADGLTVDVTGEGYEPTGEFVMEGEALAPEELSAGMKLTLEAGLLCNNANLMQDGWKVIGDPTEGALVVAAMKAGLSQKTLSGNKPRIYELPFDSARKRMSTVHELGNNRYIVYTKGAPDSVLERCSGIFEKGRVRELDEETRARIMAANSRMAERALRVLACAYRELPQLPGEPSVDTIERDLIFVGLCGMIDPPRPGVAQAVRECKEAGIRPVMITGDYKGTAVAIAREIGLSQNGDLEAVSGAELEQMSDEELALRAEDIAVYSRVSPEHKMRIVKALQHQGHVVAMTGDGVNDAPALKTADIGAAMGITGTDVAKEAADLVLADDNFVTIVEAVKQGRVIFDNIRKAITYLLSCNIGEILAIFAAIMAGPTRPLLPVQILWVNLVTDSLPALALGVERPEPGVMKRPPRRKREGVFGRGGLFQILFYGTVIGGVTLFAFYLGLGELDHLSALDIRRARTMAFAVLAYSQLFHAFNARSATASLFSLGLLSNRPMLGAFLVSGLLQFVVLTIGPLEKIFETTPLSSGDWGIVMGLSVTPVALSEIVKAVFRVFLAKSRK